MAAISAPIADPTAPPEILHVAGGMEIRTAVLQQICERVAKEIDAIASIFGEGGCIVASSNKSRIGRLHKGAAAILAGEVDYSEITAAEAAKGEILEGYTAPLEFDGHRVLCVGIAAPLEVARRYNRICRHWVNSHLKAARVEADYRAMLEEREARFRDIADSAGDWAWEVDAELRYTYLSDRFFEMFPYGRGDILGRTHADFVGMGRDPARAQQHLDDLAAHKPFRDFGYAIRLPKGDAHFIRISGKPIFGADAKFLGYRGTGSDVTKFEEIEQARRKSVQQLNDAIEAISEGFALYDADDQLIICNTRYREMMYPTEPNMVLLGLTFEQIIRRAIDLKLVQAPDGNVDAFVEQRRARHRDPQGPVVQHIKPDRWIRISERQTEEGGTVAIYTDISEIKRAEEASRAERDRTTRALEDLQQAQQQLILSEKMASLGQLTAGIAHEIKNPLNFIKNFSETSVELLDDLKKLFDSSAVTAEPKARAEIEELLTDLISDLGTIANHGKRADGIVKSMLLHARGGTRNRDAVDINLLVDEALNLAYHGERARHPAFNAKLERQFDAAAGRIELVPQEITRVLLNLLSNAFYAVTKRKAEHADSYQPLVAVATRRTGDGVEIRVRDNGPGMPPAVRSKLFQPFFTTKPPGEGTGLGLSLSYDIVVQQHAGTLEAASEEGQFTEFTLRLPAKTFARAGDGPAAMLRQQRPGPPPV